MFRQNKVISSHYRLAYQNYNKPLTAACLGLKKPLEKLNEVICQREISVNDQRGGIRTFGRSNIPEIVFPSSKQCLKCGNKYNLEFFQSAYQKRELFTSTCYNCRKLRQKTRGSQTNIKKYKKITFEELVNEFIMDTLLEDRYKISLYTQT